jgi:hypothetical protein
MSRRRKLLWLFLAACLIVGGYRLFLWYLEVRYTVRLNNLANIVDGMSEAEVEDLLGRPGDHRTRLERTVAMGETLELEGKPFVGPCEAQATMVDWVPREGAYVRIAFDEHGKVFSRSLVNDPGEASPNLLRKVRRWVFGL